MKKRINTLLASTLLLSLAPSSFAQEYPVPNHEVLPSFTQETRSTTVFHEMYALYQYRVSLLNIYQENMIRSVHLFDLNGDGVEELIFDYHPDSEIENGRVEIWTYDGSSSKINPVWKHDYSFGKYGTLVSIGSMPNGDYFIKTDHNVYGEHDSFITKVVTADGTEHDNLRLYQPSYDPPDWQEYYENYHDEISKSQYESRMAYWNSISKLSLVYETNDFGDNKYTVKVPTSATTSSSICGFSDVKPTDWYSSFTQYAVENNYMVKGYSSTHFNPDGWATRGMVAEVLCNLFWSYGFGMGSFLVSDEHNFTDAVGHLFQEEVGFCKSMPTFQGIGDNRFGVNDPITREDCALMLYSVYNSDFYINVKPADVSNLNQFSDQGQISTYAQEGVSWAIANGLIRGNEGKINPQGTLSRAELAVMLKNCKETFLGNPELV